MIEEKKRNVETPAIKKSVVADPGLVDLSQPEAPVVLSQAPPMTLHDPKPVVDKPSSVVAPPRLEKQK